MAAPFAEGRSRKAKFNDRRMEVLRVAAKTFADQGYSRATLEDIAAVLNMKRAALYYYAESKDQLLQACMDVARDSMEAILQGAEAEATGLAQLRAYCRGHVAVGRDDFGRCFLRLDDRDLSEDLRARQNAWRRGRNRRIEAMLRTGMSDGSFAHANPLALRRLLLAVMNAVPTWPAESSAARDADEALDVLIAGLAPRP